MGTEKEHTVEYDWFAIHKDIPRLDTFWHAEIQAAIIDKLIRRPEIFGKPLRQSLAGRRSLRVGDYRVVFEIRKPSVVYILGIVHRSEVYEEIAKRLGL